MGGQKNNPFSNMNAGASGDGTGGYGVTQTNGKYQSVPQIDPTAALNYYAQAGQTEAAGYKAGNSAYQAALKTAASQMVQGYNEANATLEPLSSASNQALTLFQQMLGITPESPTAKFASNLTAIDPSLTSVADLINKANSATDPAQRAALSTQVSQQLTQAGNQGVTAAQAAINALGSNYTKENPGPGLTYNAWNGGGGGDSLSQYTNNGMVTVGVDGAPDTATQHQMVAAQLAQNQANWQNQYDAANSTLTDAQQRQQQLNQFNTQWSNTYNTAAPPQAFTGDQVTKQLQSTPGYQFNLDQGNQQILRNQAAIGNLGTGNTQVALQNYGENYANNSYNGYMSNLQNLINTGVPATQQIAANQANQGGYLSNLTQLSGQANNAAIVGAANAIGQSQTLQGNTAYNAAAMNTQLQYDAYAANQSQQGQQSAMATNLANNAANNAAANQTGAGFYQGMNAVVNNAANNTYSNSGSSVKSNGGAI